MSTEHIREEAEAARKTLGQLARRAAARHREVQRELEGLATEEDNVLVGARGALRAIEDDRQVVVEELGQLVEILDAPGDADNQVEPEVPIFVQPRPEEPAPEPISTPAPADDEHDDDSDVVIINYWNPQTWSGIQWLLAIIGLMVGLMVASATWDNLVNGINGFGRGLISTAWWLALSGLGFFGGGFIGSLFNRD